MVAISGEGQINIPGLPVKIEIAISDNLDFSSWSKNRLVSPSIAKAKLVELCLHSRVKIRLEWPDAINRKLDLCQYDPPFCLLFITTG